MLSNWSNMALLATAAWKSSGLNMMSNFFWKSWRNLTCFFPWGVSHLDYFLFQACSLQGSCHCKQLVHWAHTRQCIQHNTLLSLRRYFPLVHLQSCWQQHARFGQFVKILNWLTTLLSCHQRRESYCNCSNHIDQPLKYPFCVNQRNWKGTHCHLSLKSLQLCLVFLRHMLFPRVKSVTWSAPTGDLTFLYSAKQRLFKSHWPQIQVLRVFSTLGESVSAPTSLCVNRFHLVEMTMIIPQRFRYCLLSSGSPYE